MACSCRRTCQTTSLNDDWESRLRVQRFLGQFNSLVGEACKKITANLHVHIVHSRNAIPVIVPLQQLIQSLYYSVSQIVIHNLLVELQERTLRRHNGKKQKSYDR